MKKLTRKKTIELCMEHWTLLSHALAYGAESTYITKCRTFTEVASKHGLYLPGSYCFACEYVDTLKDGRCKDCPCSAVWRPATECMRSGSPYNEWCQATNRQERLRAARKIVRRCRELLKKYRK